MRRSFLTAALTATALLFLDSASLVAQQKATVPRRGAEPKPVVVRGIIDGQVTDTLLKPLAGAEVTVLRTTAKITTNTAGRFRFTDVPSGQYLLIVKRAGYRPASAVIEVPQGDTVRLSYTLERAAQGLAAVEITEKKQSLKMLEFEQRRKLGNGEFYTAEDFEKRAAIKISDVLRYAKTMTITPDNTNNGAEIALSKREGGGFNQSGVAYCPMQILLDGIPLPTGFPMDLLPVPKSLAGVEIYGGPATAPLQYGGNDRRCGMILIWTKDGY